MTRDRAGSEKRVVLVTGFVASFVIAALLCSRVVPSRVQGRGSPRTALAAYAGAPLARAPSAFDIRRLVALGDPTSITRWAPVLRATVARRVPSARGADIGEVPVRTDDGTRNIVVADDEVHRGGQSWVKISLSMLPNDTEGWVPRSALGGWWFDDTRLVIDRARLTATLFRARRVVFRARVAVGAAASPTPEGTFYVRDRLAGFNSPLYGPLAFGTNARSPEETDWPGGGVVGIHGTDQPNLIPGRVSHGCVRLTNAAIVKLGKLMPIGTPVTIR